MSLNIVSNAERSKCQQVRLRRRHTLSILLAAGLIATATRASSQDARLSPKPPNTNTSAVSPKTSIKTSKKPRWYQIGEASWYGPRFQGHHTANGESFDTNSLTCAHRDLPLGSWLRVTNLHNHKTVIVRVNDRGPMVDGRIIDLSHQAMTTISAYDLAYVRLDLISQQEATKSMITNISSLEVPALLPIAH
jgi:rare lipoprotein A